MTGYNELAKLMGLLPELGIFRKFGALNAKNLLYLQAELHYLEEELDLISDLDELNPSKRGFDRCWKKMHEASSEHGADKQRKKVEHMQVKLRAYYEMLVLTAQVQNLAAPNGRGLTVLRECLERGTGVNDMLDQIEADPWDASNGHDLVALSPEGVNDDLAAYLDSKLVPLYHRFIGSRSAAAAEGVYGKAWYYSSKHLGQLGNFLCILLSAGINVASIVAMNVVSDARTRLLMMAGFCVVFAMAMSLITACRRADVFAATTAFAAVQAMFAGGANLLPTN